MEELFEIVIALVVIAASLIKMMSKANKVRQNAPGKAEMPVKQTAPAASAERMRSEQSARSVPAQPTVKPTVQPSGGVQLPEFWKQVSEAIKEEFDDLVSDEKAQPATGHEAVGRMAEGDSRECEHGSVGGSMAYEGHQEGREERRDTARRPSEPNERAMYRPAMNAEEMRRAVVMAEILKRPQDRMAEQARRWTAR